MHNKTYFDKNYGINYGINNGINTVTSQDDYVEITDKQKRIVILIKENPAITNRQLAEK